MKQILTIMSTYTADVSGICSALFELGGMVVMHDASGCNSTYNTHDEPRWYDYDSMVYISGLSEMEAIMGDDQKLINDMVDTAKELQPNFTAIAGTPIPMMTGCDIPALAKSIENETGIISFGFNTNGMHSYQMGVSEALAVYAERMIDDEIEKTSNLSANILGATPLDFSICGNIQSMKDVLIEEGIEVISTWAMGSTPEELAKAGSASVNLVISYSGLKVAKVLQRKFGTPYVMGTPTGRKFSQKIVNDMKIAANGKKNIISYANRKISDSPDIVIIGESITSESLASAIYEEYGKVAKVICPIETEKELLMEGDINAIEEDEIIEILEKANTIIADPLYKLISPEKAEFYRYPHEAYSGRMYRDEIKDIVKTFTL